MGTTSKAAQKMQAKSSSTRHGPGVKNVQSTAKGKGRGMPPAPTKPIKGRDRGTG